MSSYEWFVFFLCLFIFAGLVLFLGILIFHIFNLSKRLIVGGLEDEKIITAKRKEKYKRENGFLIFIEKAISIIVIFALTGSFIFSLVVKTMEDITPNGMSTVQVVLSDSMSYKNKKNEYLVENNLDNQLKKYDMVLIHQIPDEFDLKLYDIVVYRHEKDILLIHRIVGIEEPNSSHPNSRYFVLKGDANSYNDNFPVKYEQLVGIYRGEKVENVGSFVIFLQSPAGWLCIVFVIFMTFFIPFVEEKLKDEEDKRYKLIVRGFADHVVKPVSPKPKNKYRNIQEFLDYIRSKD